MPYGTGNKQRKHITKPKHKQSRPERDKLGEQTQKAKEELRLMDIRDESGFHVNNHLFFKRLEDGSVLVRKFDEKPPFELQSEVVIPAGGWASVVASVSKAGETGETFREALEFHNADKADEITLLREVVKKIIAYFEADQRTASITEIMQVRLPELKQAVEVYKKEYADRIGWVEPTAPPANTIIVNAKEHTVVGDEITYTQVACLAFPDRATHEGLSMTFSKGDIFKPRGCLILGQSVPVRSGMIFNAVFTGSA